MKSDATASGGRTGGSRPAYNQLTQLGRSAVRPPLKPEEARLEAVPNPHPDSTYVVRFACPEFTSLCPVTGQPDFAHIVIDYVPRNWIVESKSLKLYLQSFRNHGDFHEACTILIGKTLFERLDPVWMRVGAYWFPRGGIPIDIFWSFGEKPDSIYLPDQGVPAYRGR